MIPATPFNPALYAALIVARALQPLNMGFPVFALYALYGESAISPGDAYAAATALTGESAISGGIKGDSDAATTFFANAPFTPIFPN